MSDQHIPIACSLPERQLVMRRQEISGDIFNVAEQVEELADGYAFRYAYNDAQVAKLIEFIASERRCCPFFTFELVFEPAQGPCWLRLRGPEGTKEFIRNGLNVPNQPA